MVFFLLYQNARYQPQPLNLTFRDYVLTLKKLEEGPLYHKSKQYWLQRLEQGFCGSPQLLLHMHPSLIQSPKFKRLKQILKKEQWDKIREFGRSFNLTPPTLLIGAFSEILKLWSKSSDFTLNLTLFNRLPVHSDVNEILGDFTSLTLLEIKSNADSIFVERLLSIQKQLWTDLEHRYFSGPRVNRALLNKTGEDHAFPIVFTSLLNQDSTQVTSTPFEVSFTNNGTYSVSQTPQVWLDHQVMDRADGLHFNWDIVEELFPENLIETMFEAYSYLLEELANVPDAWTDKDPLQECGQFKNTLIHKIKEYSINKMKNGKDALIHSDFFYQASIQPNRIAVVGAGRSLTYGEVAQLSSQIAHSFNQCDIAPGELIAVVMDKSWEMLVSIIGVLKAGGAFLPIDASIPNARIKEMLDISGVKHVVVKEKKNHSFISNQSILNAEFDIEKPVENTSIKLTLSSTEQLAYAFFTSGSTGQPKCVEITHQAAINTLDEVNKKYRISKDDAVLSLSSFSFDLSVFDIFGMLSVGGKIVIPHSSQAKDPYEWAKLITNEKVTIWNTTPALMQMLHSYVCQTETSSVLQFLRLVMLSGDIIPVALAIDLKNTFKISDVVSLGGATEGAIWSIWYDIKGDEANLNSIPYGKAMPNQLMLVLNDKMRECPIWLEGELYIGGRGIALGYRNNLGQTKSRFVDHPIWGRIYKTGDRGRYRADGEIEFLGRLDNQVKIRGHRVELGEVEAKINKHELVKSSVVCVETSENGEKNLAGYIEIKNTIPEGIITDPLERLHFKLSNKGIRKSETNSFIQFDKHIEPKTIDQFIRRKSSRNFVENEFLSHSQLDRFLGHLRSIELPGIPFEKRFYGSGGGLYPVQIYLFVKPQKISGLSEGVYYYHPRLHQLNFINEATISSSSFPPNNRVIFDSSSALLFLVADLNAIEPMYGKDESQRLVLIETGLISQLLEMHGPDCNIGVCQVGGVDFDTIKTPFELDNSCQFLHCLAIGPITHSDLSLEGLLRDIEVYSSSDKQVHNNGVSATSAEEDLKQFLSQQLPHYMIPQTLHFVSKIPLTLNGKLDRSACKFLKTDKNQNAQHMHSLKEVSNSANPIKIDFELEDALADIWRLVLKDKSFTPTDNFFDVGGSSVNAVIVYREIQNRINSTITMIDLFKHTTIRSLANFLSQSKIHNCNQRLKEEENRSLARKAALDKKRMAAKK